MELQLGLGLTSCTAAVNGFDLNSYGYDPNKEIVDPQLSWNDVCSNKKRSFDDAFEFEQVNVVPRTLPLLFCNNQPNEDDDPKDNENNSSFSCNKLIDEEGVVGWPPIKTWRKKLCHQRVKNVNNQTVVPRTLPLLFWNNQPNEEDDHKDLDTNSSFASNKTADEEGVVGWPPIKTSRKKLSYQHHGGRAKNVINQTMQNGGRQYSNSMHVKVKMEGVVIARKIDLSLHGSFESLTATLISMFGIWYEDSSNYKLTYQDREGDWLIAQDVPWRTFIRTVQRLKLVKSSD